VKIATVVEPEELDGFYVRYAEVCRAGMDALKKRDRSKGKKRKKEKKGKDGGVK
jgi:signal recognition particle subunit SRP14